MDFDCLVVGSGISGLVFAERFAAVCKGRVLVIEQRSHIGGNCYDEQDEHGVLIHRYGPHIFHTESERVWQYLSRFTDWIPYQHKVLAAVDGMLMPVPFNLNSIRQAFPGSLADRFERALIERFAFGARVPILELKKHGELEDLWRYVYDTIFLNYTLKQWGIGPEDLDDSVTARVPVVVSRDDRYFQDRYQGMPAGGYRSMLAGMAAADRVSVLTQCDALEMIEIDSESGRIKFMGRDFPGLVVYTGLIDRLFDYRFGRLPYRSLDFVFEHHDREFYQSSGVVNFPNEFDYTRITEYKRLTAQRCAGTSVSKEIPCDFKEGRNTPCYPINKPENRALFSKYKDLAEQVDGLICLGRLADYAYYNMDAAVARALDAFDEVLRGRSANPVGA